jgi:hypothetical protein
MACLPCFCVRTCLDLSLLLIDKVFHFSCLRWISIRRYEIQIPRPSHHYQVAIYRLPVPCTSVPTDPVLSPNQAENQICWAQDGRNIFIEAPRRGVSSVTFAVAIIV